MNSETRTCQNCRTQFVIEPDDFNFYKKMDVPPPTFCPGCRYQRRLIFRNDRFLHKRPCDLCGKEVLSMFAPDSGIVSYCQPCWWSDKWDPLEYGMDYDQNRPFFEQLKELRSKVPHAALSTGYSTLVNSDYTNEVAYLKNCYWIFNADYDENVSYGYQIDKSSDSMDGHLLNSSQLCYETINCESCNRVFFSEDCISCTDIYFSKDLSGCSNCFGCANLRNKKYYIWNKPHSKEDYESKLKEFGLDSWKSVQGLRNKALTFWLTKPRKYMEGTHNVNVSGSYVWESKNAKDMYQARGVENGRFSQGMSLGPSKDIYDQTQWGNRAELIYETLGGGEGAYMIRFGIANWSESSFTEYSFYAISSSYQFGCVCTRKKKFCILNKQYTEEEYKSLRQRIISDMNEKPYIDSMGRVWKYGEFFPYDLTAYPYNETSAPEHFPLSKDEALAKGWRWREPRSQNYQPTLAAEDIPDSISETQDSILNEILSCSSCGKAYRIIPGELDLLRRFNFSVPRQCPNCRHMARINRTNPPKLWDRTCAKCGKAIRTSYAPDRPEIVYCEECYQKEVVG